ncbi:HIR complex subunit [Pseudogymnoascus australis]
MSGVDGPGTSRYSSSPELSSPPCSPSDPGSPAARQLLRDQRDAQDSGVGGGAASAGGGGVVDERASLPSAPPTRKKPGRKPKVPVAADGASATSTDAKPKRGRKPREPKDPNAAPVPRKKRATASTSAQDADAPENNNNNNTITAVAAKPAHAATTRQSKLTDMNVRPANEPGYSILNEPFQPQPQHQYNAATAAAPQNGKFEDIQKATPVSFFNSAPPPQPQPQQQQPQQSQPVRSSGQNYDPIRGNMPSHSPYAQMSPKPAPSNRASASPSIASLVDPPHQSSTSPSMAAQSFFQHQMKMHTSVPPSPTSNRVVPSPTMNTSTGPSPSSGVQSATRSRQEEPKPYVRASAPPPSFTANPAQITSISNKPSPSTAPAKPSKPIDATPPPLPGQGSGFFNAPKDGTESRAPTIVLHIPLNGGSNKYINFTRLAEERYGWDALHPRLAAQRERLARVAAAGAALEKSGHKESGDEMSLDMSDNEGDNSNVEMGGVSDGRTGTDAGGATAAKKVVKKRRMKEDDYDKDDEFVDDSDLLWEEQAAASVDGFFVYSGPLVPEGEKPALERGEGSKRARGSRGRGGARVASGTRGGHAGSAAGAAGGAGAAGKDGGKEGSARGGGATRKPRITKADRARRDAEKVERERMGVLAVRGGYGGGMERGGHGGGVHGGHHLGGTPMVFETGAA